MQRRLIMLERIFKAGAVNFVRNSWLAVAAIAVITITLSIVLFLVIANATFTNTIQQITDRIDVSVYLKDDVTAEQRDKLIDDLKRIDNVKSVDYISKNEALERYREQNKDDIDLLVAINQTDNPLPASLQIKPRDPNQLESLRGYLESPDIKKLQSDETSYSGDRKEAIDKISRATNFFREAGVVGVIVFIIVSMLIIFNTIRMAIFNRRDELAIMRLLGATPWYIRGPFVVETMLYGVIAAVISVSLCNLLFSVASTTFEASSLGLLDINYSSQYFSNRFWQIFGGQLLIGILVGGLSSIIATRRYLKLKTSR